MPRWATGAAGCVNARQSSPALSRPGADGFQAAARDVAPEATRSRVHLPGATPDAAPPPRARCPPTAGGRAGRRGAADWSPLPPGAGWLKTLCPKGTSHDESGGSAPPGPPRAQVAVRGPGSRGPLPAVASADRRPCSDWHPREADGAGRCARSERDGRAGPPPTRAPTDAGHGRPKPGRMIPPPDTPPRGPRRVALRLHGRAPSRAPARSWRRASWVPIQPALKHGPRSLRHVCEASGPPNP
ncbi:hypothetical protein H6P81_021238 [Aristolochia fimbriata]|uniref:Uncharacterized protein n=1 Tax=Aristolochia fimbriata TaxID=158543 RepID=A0AAV7DQH1_ARIFI|nr:hypothetical protein H6P81_021238 [Aristolochia fimbriata]